MNITLPMLIVLIIIAAICGAIGKAIGGGARGGFLLSMVLGFVGAVVGPWVALQLHLREPFMVSVDGHPFPILWSIVGAALVVGVLHLLSGSRGRRFRLGR